MSDNNVIYTFFKNGDGDIFVESTNWCMPYKCWPEEVRAELRRILKDHPYCQDSIKEEFRTWLLLTSKARRRIKDAYFKKEEESKMKSNSKSIGYNFLFGNCDPVPPACYSGSTCNLVSMDPCYPNQQKGNNPMNYNTVTVETTNASTVEKDQRRFLFDHLNNARYDQRRDLQKHFHVEPIGPDTIGEVIEWIKSDKFEIKDEFLKTRDIYGAMSYIRWMDKDNPPDEKGYAAALEKMEKAFTDASRVIKIKSPEAGLDALTAFETASFTA